MRTTSHHILQSLIHHLLRTPMLLRKKSRQQFAISTAMASLLLPVLALTIGVGQPASAAIATRTFTPQADARVENQYPNTNYGTSSQLSADGSPTKESYLRFTVTNVSGTIQSAKLRVYAYDGSTNGPAVFKSSNTWSETTITWNNRPARTSAATDDKGAVSANAWTEFNVTPLVTGNGTYSFILASTSYDGFYMYSREATSNKPQLVLTINDSATPSPTPSPTPTPWSGATLLFEDTFNSTSLDTAKWNTQIWGKPSTNSTQHLSMYVSDNVRVQNGYVRLTADNIRRQGVDWSGRPKTYNYGAAIITHWNKPAFQYRYGYFEIRARMSHSGSGAWRSFYTLPTNGSWPPEIDVLEHLGKVSPNIALTHHWKDANGTNQSLTAWLSDPQNNRWQDWHTFAIDWQPGRITWYVDGIVRRTVTTNVPTTPMYLILDNVVGNLSGWSGVPDGTSVFPHHVDIDYVRVWNRNPYTQ
jgi:beta-glucanase (GH16 family)